jgi:hypothetical protein
VNSRYPRVSDRAVHRCEYCHAPEAIFNFPFEVEHVIPRSREGLDDDSNLALACRSCNLYKTNATLWADEVTGADAALFNPRVDNWQDHFTLDAETAEIRGLTPIGRVTVSCLRMNSLLQLQARQLWKRLGLFA